MNTMRDKASCQILSGVPLGDATKDRAELTITDQAIFPTCASTTYAALHCLCSSIIKCSRKLLSVAFLGSEPSPQHQAIRFCQGVRALTEDCYIIVRDAPMLVIPLNSSRSSSVTLNNSIISLAYL